MLSPVYNSHSCEDDVLVSERLMQRLAFAIVIVGAVALSYLLLYAKLLNKQAESIVRTAYELCAQKQAPTLADIRGHFGTQIKQLDEWPHSLCAYTVILSNRILAALHLAPYTQMESYFLVRDGTVLGDMVNYTTTVNHRYTVVAHVQIDFCKGCQMFAIHPWDQSSPLDTNGLVEIGNEASAHNRRTVLSLNTACLTRVGGCDSVADLLPTVWQKTANGRIACKIGNDEGFVQKPAD
jgi:hypothetical protein